MLEIIANHGTVRKTKTGDDFGKNGYDNLVKSLIDERTILSYH